MHIRPLTDDELLAQLEAGATIIFDGQTIQWHEIERQVERLGFGDLYLVSATQRLVTEQRTRTSHLLDRLHRLMVLGVRSKS